MDLQKGISQLNNHIASFDKLLEKLELFRTDLDFKLKGGGYFNLLFSERLSIWKKWLGILSDPNLGKKSRFWNKKNVEYANERASKVLKHLEDHKKDIAGVQAEFKTVFIDFLDYEAVVEKHPDPEPYKRAVIRSLNELLKLCVLVGDID